jgi:putative SOS response-associated peptidase YedK
MVEEYFHGEGEDDWVPRYNIAPTQLVPIIRQNPKESRRELSLVRWGLIPSWAKDSSGAARMINARSETAETLPEEQRTAMALVVEFPDRGRLPRREHVAVIEVIPGRQG